jgi:hypothetical protein
MRDTASLVAHENISYALASRHLDSTVHSKLSRSLPSL